MEADGSKTKRAFRVSVEGNIGSGKSTFLNYFKEFPDVDIYLEPIEEWRNVKGHNLFNLKYADPYRWNFTFQHYVQLTRLKMLTKPTDKKVQIFERSIQNNRFCFAELSHSEGYLAPQEFLTLCQWYEWAEKNMNIELDLVVYLRGTPKIVHDRMMKRNRPEENCIPIASLEKLHEIHEHWLTTNPPAPVLVIDVNQDFSHVKSLYDKNAPYILGHKPFIQSNNNWL